MGEDKAELLVSVSADGQVLQWTIRKGLEAAQLMKLKRMAAPKVSDKKPVKAKHGSSRAKAAATVSMQMDAGEAYLSQHAPGMGFDFSPKDSNMYVLLV